MTTKEERIKEIIIAKEEKVRARNTEVAVRHVRRAKEHIKEGRELLKLSINFLSVSDNPEWKDEVKNAMDLVSEANSILVRYDMWD